MLFYVHTFVPVDQWLADVQLNWSVPVDQWLADVQLNCIMYQYLGVTVSKWIAL